MDQATIRLRADWVIPIAGQPIAGGEVMVEEGRIVEVTPAPSSSAADVLDLGHCALLPGLVNAHTHLDYTVMRGRLEDLSFFPWIRAMVTLKTRLDEDDWLVSARLGAWEAVRSGITTIADATDSGAALDAALDFGLRGIVYQETFGMDESIPVEAIMGDLKQRIEEHRQKAKGSRIQIGVSPHSPYTVRGELFRRLAEYCNSQELPVCIHAAESLDEGRLFRDGSGPIGEMYAERGIAWHPPGATSIAYLDSLGILSDRTLLVHGVQLAAADRKLLQRYDLGWVHCPKSNAKLGVGAALFGLLEGCYDSDKARVGLGSDSVASNNTMDLFEEMRFAVLLARAQGRRVDLMTARRMLETATIGGARCLHLEPEIGTLEPGKRADICAVRLDGSHIVPVNDPVAALVYSCRAGDVRLTMVEGEILYDGEKVTGVNEAELYRQAEAVMKKLQGESSL